MRAGRPAWWLCSHTNVTPRVCVLQVLPEAPRELVEELSRRYVMLYERITGQEFVPPPSQPEPNQRIADNLRRVL